MNRSDCDEARQVMSLVTALYAAATSMRARCSLSKRCRLRYSVLCLLQASHDSRNGVRSTRTHPVKVKVNLLVSAASRSLPLPLSESRARSQAGDLGARSREHGWRKEGKVGRPEQPDPTLSRAGEGPRGYTSPAQAGGGG